MTYEIRQGDALAVLRTLPDGIAQTCVTSPPYWGLRDYGTAKWCGGDESCDHKESAAFVNPKNTLGPNGFLPPSNAANQMHQRQYRTNCGKCGARRIDSQVGLEATPEEYVARLVEVFREVRRVLRDDGTLWLNLGDSYTGPGGGPQGKTGDRVGRTFTGEMGGIRRGPGGKPKDLVGIPWSVAFALRADGWYLRSDIIWHKPNPMPESVTDRPTKAHEYLFLLAKAERYYYDADAIAEPALNAGDVTLKATRNRRSVWTIASQPFPESHFAVMPEALVEPCILAGSKPGDTVLDPFAGSGTTGVVSLRHGRRFLGIELNTAYVEMARRRIAGPLFAGEEN